MPITYAVISFLLDSICVFLIIKLRIIRHEKSAHLRINRQVAARRIYFLASYFPHIVQENIFPTRRGTDLFQNVSSPHRDRRDVARENAVGAVRHVLDLQLCASRCAIAGRENGGFPLSLGQEIKTQSRWLAEFCAAACFAHRNSVERRNI